MTNIYSFTVSERQESRRQFSWVTGAQGLPGRYSQTFGQGCPNQRLTQSWRVCFQAHSHGCWQEGLGSFHVVLSIYRVLSQHSSCLTLDKQSKPGREREREWGSSMEASVFV